ncbi:MAG: murein hydrolase activator EnvC family protein [Acidimicrobiia bacterium]
MHSRHRGRGASPRTLVTVALALLAGAPPQVGAHPSPTLRASAKDERVAELQELMGEVSTQEADLLGALAGIRERLDAHNATVRRFNRQVYAIGRKLETAEEDLSDAQGRQGRVIIRLLHAQAKVETARDAMNATVTALYQQGNEQERAAYASIVEHSRSPHEMFLAARYLQGSIRSHRANLDAFLAAQAQVETLRREAERRTAAAEAVREETTLLRERTKALRAEAQAARDAIRRDEEREATLLAEVQARKAEFERELQLLQAESSAIGQMLRDLQAHQKLAPRRKDTFRLPVDGPMSSHFGPRVHPIFGDTRIHTGLDFNVGHGTPIRAAGPGRVVWAGPRGGYGNLVAVDHGNGLATLYAHQSMMKVTYGSRVAPGQLIGWVGSTGFSTGPHLHFEVREKGTPVDPLAYL